MHLTCVDILIRSFITFIIWDFFKIFGFSMTSHSVDLHGISSVNAPKRSFFLWYEMIQALKIIFMDTPLFAPFAHDCKFICILFTNVKGPIRLWSLLFKAKPGTDYIENIHSS